MSKFIMLYRGPATDMADMTEAQGKEVMAAWGVWMERIGAGLADVGSPFGPSASVVDNGSSGKAGDLNGYSIVEAADLAAARRMADGHPFLKEGKGRFAVDIYELMPVPM
jgi:hypothetical protein